MRSIAESGQPRPLIAAFDPIRNSASLNPHLNRFTSLLWSSKYSKNIRMNKHEILLRISYWVAAVADFIIAFLVLIPERMGVSGFVYPMGLMSAIAFSWGVLLLVADRKPLERRWVLAPTILVVLLLGLVGVYAGLTGLLPVGRILASSVAVIVVLALLIFTWFKTRIR